MRLAPRAAAAAVAATALAIPLLAPSAQGASAGAGTLRQTLRSDAAVARTDCATRNLAGRRGVATASWTSPYALSLRAALAGAAGSDWDLAVFDRTTGERLGGSAAWGSSEVVTALVPAGTPIAATTGQKRHSTAKLIDIPLAGRSAVSALEALGIDLVDNPHGHSTQALIHSDDELATLKRAGFEYRVLVGDVAKFDAQQQARTARYTRLMGREGSPLPSGRTEYRQYEDYQAELKKLASDFPAIVRPVTLPVKTFQGRQQTGVEISSDVNRGDDQKPVAFIMGAHHAREWPSAELNMEFALYLANGFGTDAQVTELLRHVRVFVVPIINPDGFVSSRGSQDPADQSPDPLGAPSLAESVAIGGSLAYRRKNCKGPGGPSAPCDFNNGVDPNRNYGLGWGGPGASTTPTSQSYRGPGPFSEEETQSVHAFSRSHDITALLTMHNFASLVLRPPGRHNDGLAPDEERLKTLGDAMAEDTGYTSQYGWQLYDTSGTTEDWNYGAAGTFGYTMELGPPSEDEGNFHIAYDRGVVEQWVGTGDREGRGVRRALLRVVEEAATRQDHSTLIGRAPAGRILRLKKTFKTATSPICEIASPSDVRPNLPLEDPVACVNPGDPMEFDDGLEYTTRVPANSVFSWIVTPSTRPFEYKAGKRESWTLTCEDDAGKVYESQQVEIWRGELKSFELPCGGTLPTSGPTATTPQTFEEAQKVQLVDTQPPKSTFTRSKVRFGRKGVFVQGTSTDFAPQGLTPRVAKVRITIGEHVGNLCRYLDAEGQFGKKIRCKRTPYVIARVKSPNPTVRWKYSLGAQLPKGRYFAWVRGIDGAGNVERKARPRNLVKFRIR